MFVFADWREPMASDEASKRERASRRRAARSPRPPNSVTPTPAAGPVDGNTFWRAQGTQRVDRAEHRERDRARSGALPVDGLDAGIAGGGRAGGEPLPRRLPLHGRRAGLDAAGDPARDGAPGAEAGAQSGAGDPTDGAGPLSALPRGSLARLRAVRRRRRRHPAPGQRVAGEGDG